MTEQTKKRICATLSKDILEETHKIIDQLPPEYLHRRFSLSAYIERALIERNDRELNK